MAAIGQRTRWAPPVTAQVDWSNPLSVGLAAALLADGSSWVDLTGNLGRLIPGTSERRSPGATPFGSGTAAHAVAAATPTGLLGTNRSCSVTAVCRAATFDRGNIAKITVLASSEGTVPGTPYASLVFFGTNGNQPFFGSGINNASDVGVTGTVWSSGQSGIITGVSAENGKAIWENGVRTASTASVPTLGTMTRPVSLLQMADGTGANQRIADHPLPLLLWHNRPLSNSEIAALHADPFQMLRW